MSKIIPLLLVLALIAGCSNDAVSPDASPDKSVIVVPTLGSIKAYVSSLDPPALTVTVDFPTEADYTIKIENITGYVLKKQDGHGVGEVTIEWDMKSENGDLINTGIYIVELELMNDNGDIYMVRSPVYIELG